MAERTVAGANNAPATGRPTAGDPSQDAESSNRVAQRTVWTATTAAELRAAFDAASAAYQNERFPTRQTRDDRLRRLDEMISSHGIELAEALVEDYGNRSLLQTIAAEAITASGQIRHTRKHLKKWMKQRRKFAGSSFHAIGGSAVLQPQPLGVVGIISPWNFPVALTMAPLASALAAGNRALCKVSELTPHTAAVLERITSEWFSADEVTMILGGPEVAKEFTKLPFNHLFFTGSTAVGRQVMLAAAENLTPVTLELGGKSPFVVADDGNVSAAATTLISGKIFNAGQYCVAPDRVYVANSRADEFLDACRAEVAKRSEHIDTTSIINEHHYERVIGLRNDAIERGAKEIVLSDETSVGADNEPSSSRTIAPVALVGVDDSMAISHEEVFGPIFTLERFDHIDEVIADLNAGPEPLAAYYFGARNGTFKKFVTQTAAGGVVINDIMIHVGLENLPFGGVGQSGMGAYHGQAGFDTFSHLKPIVKVHSPITPRTTTPPKPELVESLMRRTLHHRSGKKKH